MSKPELPHKVSPKLYCNFGYAHRETLDRLNALIDHAKWMEEYHRDHIRKHILEVWDGPKPQEPEHCTCPRKPGQSIPVDDIKNPVCPDCKKPLNFNPGTEKRSQICGPIHVTISYPEGRKDIADRIFEKIDQDLMDALNKGFDKP